MKKHLISALVIFNIVLLLLVSVPVGLARRGSSVFDEIDLLVDVRHEIVEQYVEEPDREKLIEAAVRAMVDALDDRYTVFLTPEELKPFDKQIRGTFSGIGAEIDLYQDHLRIVSPLEESPAWKAGVMAGDIVLEIDGKSTEGIKITEAVQQLTGPEGTDVTIKVRHDSGDEQDITITRAKINVRTVKGLQRSSDNHWDYMLNEEHKIGYLRITQFTGTTADDTQKALDQLIERGAKGLIIDLRFNPGGLLESAVAISDMFLKPDKRIVSIKGRAVPERVEMSTGDTTIPNIPIVVIANEASASASEIVTGALSDNQRAKFIGTRTFGKGSVQQVKMLESGQGALKITNAYYYLPNGRNIHRRPENDVWGVDPDDGFYVPMTPDQIKKMIEVRRESDILRSREASDDPLNLTPEWIDTELADLQLAAALESLIGKITDGQWVRVGKSGADQLARQSKRESLVRQRDLINKRLGEIKEELTKLETQDAEDGLIATHENEAGTEPETGLPDSPLIDTDPAAGPTPPVDESESPPTTPQPTNGSQLPGDTSGVKEIPKPVRDAEPVLVPDSAPDHDEQK